MSNVDEHRPTARVLDILEALASCAEGMNLTALADATGVLKGTIFPIVKTLSARRYVQLDSGTMRYCLGIGCVALAEAGMSNSVWIKGIHDEMQAVVAGCDEVCQLGILEGPNVLYIAKVQSQRQVRLVSHVGKRLPAASTALGKAILSTRGRSCLQELYPRGLRAFTRHTTTSLEELMPQLELVKQRGYAVDDRELNEETVCLAVPLRQRGNIIAAMSVSIPVFRASDETRERILALLFTAQKRIETMLGSLPELNLHEETVAQ